MTKPKFEIKQKNEKIKLACGYCCKLKEFSERSFEASSGCMYFCSGDCEDKFAWFEEPMNHRHKDKESSGDE